MKVKSLGYNRWKLIKIQLDVKLSEKCLIFMQDYSTEGMSESQLKFLQHLREFGLVFQRKVLRRNQVFFLANEHLLKLYALFWMLLNQPGFVVVFY